MPVEYADVKQRVASKAAKLKPRDRDEVGLLGTFVGALYALGCAAELEYDGKRLENESYMKDEFLDVARHLSQNGAPMPQPWLTSFMSRVSE